MRRHMIQRRSARKCVFHWQYRQYSQYRMMRPGNDQRGIFALATALSLVALFAFTALGIEVGRWYVIRAELSKAVDAAAMVGAKNLSNPFLDTTSVGSTVGLMDAVGLANFGTGFFGTDGDPVFTSDDTLGEGKVSVTASTNAINRIARVLDPTKYDQTTIGANGVAQQRDVEIVMVLDKSGSMSGAINDLKEAAKSFIDFFAVTEDNDKFGLISFASGVEIDFAMGPYFVQPMQTAIDNMAASGGTNTEDAIDQADGPSGFTDQTGVPGDQQVQQFLIFFSDGNPTAFRGTFTRDGTDYDAVGYAADWDIKLMDPNVQFAYLNVKQYKTGDGLSSGSTSCQSGSPPSGYSNTKWWILDDPTYGVNGYSTFLGVNYADLLNTYDPEICDLAKWRGKNYVEAITKQMAIDHAQELKDKGIKIYTIGLGSVDQNFLSAIASGPGFEFYTPDSTELTMLFQKIATNIKLRLIQ